MVKGSSYPRNPNNHTQGDRTVKSAIFLFTFDSISSILYLAEVMSRRNVVCSVPAAERHNCISTAIYLHRVDGTPCGAGFLLRRAIWKYRTC